MQDKVVVIILNYNQNQYTINCIESLLNLDYENFQVLLIDNGSTEENYNELKRSAPNDQRIVLHRIYPNVGYFGGVNTGLEQGAKLNPQYFLIMNNDTIIDNDAVSEIVKCCKKFNNNAIVSGKVYHYDDPERLQYVGSKLINSRSLKFQSLGTDEIDEGQYENVEERDMMDDIFWLIPANLYNEIGSYSPFFWFNNEQADFALRAKNAGYKLIYTPHAKLWHKGSVSIGGRKKNPALAYWTVQSSLIFRYRHLSKLQFSLFYFETLISIGAYFINTIINYIRNKDYSFGYVNAKFEGLKYFNKWIISKTTNDGFNPYQSGK